MSIEEFVEKMGEIKDRRAQVEHAASYILESKKKTSTTKTMSTKELIEEYLTLKKNHPLLVDIPENTMTVYVSQLANSSESKINCPGKKQGYYLDNLLKQIEVRHEVDEEIANQETEIKDAKDKGYLIEKDLYPYLERWLFTAHNERVADISKQRGQGKWANPDLLGLKIDYFFQSPQIEITTIEAKILIDNWEQWIFEAVAHTVFSNRSYYAFVHSEEHIKKIPSELRHYAERFGVGVLIFEVDIKDLVKIQKKEPFELTDQNHTIYEYIPAPYQTPLLKFQKKFLECLNVKDHKDLLTFGKSIEK
jgi:ribosomal protein L17